MRFLAVLVGLRAVLMGFLRMLERGLLVACFVMYGREMVVLGRLMMLVSRVYVVLRGTMLHGYSSYEAERYRAA